ncbi:MAG: hypothetical protein GW763_06385 [Paraglaciecola sp.]|nr:hypothetical protein [Paraglaciecola sp.]NCT47612.1 hypothetical protein [Paraglaciecola sp.]
MSDEPKSFFNTLPGVLTGLASLIVAITGLYAATDGFNFSSTKPESKQVEQPKLIDDAAEHQRQIAALKRQQELDEIRLAQEKKRLLAEQELADIKAKADKLRAQQEEDNREKNRKQTPSIANVHGAWAFTNMMGTYILQIQQDGQYLSIQEFDSDGNNVGNGSGTIDGRKVMMSLVEPYLFITTIDVEVELTLSEDGSALRGTMQVDGNTSAITLFRR